ncbi:MAG: sodium:solute symporter family protein [Planctomycetota bacterium]|jgi:SSS family transporter
MIGRAKRIKYAILTVLFFTAMATVQAADEQSRLEWGRLSDVPGVGYAGAYAGISNGKLILAGGANFANSEAGLWCNQVYTLDIEDALSSSKVKDKKPRPAWQEAKLKLPSPMAYGVSVSYHTKDGRELVVCVGGRDDKKCYRNVFTLEYTGGRVRFEKLPELPEPTACMAGAVIGSKLYVACGISAVEATSAGRAVYLLDLEQPQEGWQKPAPLPAAGRLLPVAAAQDGKFYVMSGAELEEGPDGKVTRRYLTDTWRYWPVEGWKKMAEVPRPVLGAPSPAFAAGQLHFIVFGGDNGSPDGGFNKKSLAYHTVTNTWVEYADIGDAGLGLVASVAAPGMELDGTYIVPTGQMRPSVETAQVYTVAPAPYKGRFGLIDYATIVIYLGVLLGIGYYFSFREKDTDDYFRGGLRVPWFVAGLSAFATLLSSITYMAMPAKAFNTNWLYFIGHLSLLIVVPIVIYFYLPFFRRLNISSAYEYLEHRFNVVVRLCGTLLFTGFHIGRIAVVLLLPSMALATISPINVYACIIIVAGLCIIYTVLGGIEAVVWTDAIQSFVLFFGAFLTVVIILSNESIGLSRFWEVVAADGKNQIFDFRMDHTLAVFWVVLVGSFFSNLSSYTSDQAVVQRYFVTPSEKTAAKTLWTALLTGLPIGFMFLFVGTCLYVYFKTYPGLLEPTVKSDAIFPLFVVKQMPAGLAGLVIAGLFAAAQSTLSSSLNSISTVLVEDIYKRFRPGSSDHNRLRMARALTIFVGVAGTAIAVAIAALDIKSLWDVFLRILGLFGGGMGGLFFMGIFTKRTNGGGVVCGLVCSAVMLYVVQAFTDVSFFLYAAIGMVICVVVGYIASFLWPGDGKDLAGLTVFTRK